MIKFENETNGRFYYLEINKDLLNESVLRITYGGRHISRTRTVYFGSEDSISKEIERITKKRIKRGYQIVT